MFYNETYNPDNKGFCSKCLGNGVLNISNCYGGNCAHNIKYLERNVQILDPIFKIRNRILSDFYKF